MIYLLSLRAKCTGGAVTSGSLVTRTNQASVGLGTIGQLRREDQITILLHGFNVNCKQGERTLLALANKLLPHATGHGVLAVLWPGDHWTRALSYSFEGKDADDSAKALARYLEDIARLTSGTRLQFVTHSLGARVALETVKALTPHKYVVGEICLLAAAVDDFSLAKRYKCVVKRASRTSVLASRSDRVLELAYPLGDLLQRFVFFRKEQVGLALGYHGPRPKRRHKVPSSVHHVQIPDCRHAGHGDYLPAPRCNPEQKSSVAFTDQVLHGHPHPAYK